MHAAPGRIGPNAITRVAEALQHQLGRRPTDDLFERAGLAAHLHTPPQQMVDEAHARRLHVLLRDTFGPLVAASIGGEAGVATAEYLLAHRIPKPVQALLRLLPARLACRVLLAAIRRHAWTFVGSGSFAARAGRPARLTIRANPLCHGVVADVPVCAYYAATFERLFRRLVHRDTRVTERSCEACGDDACRFELRW